MHGWEWAGDRACGCAGEETGGAVVITASKIRTTLQDLQTYRRYYLESKVAWEVLYCIEMHRELIDAETVMTGWKP